MRMTQPATDRKGGFALLLVLGLLTVITILFAISQTRVLSQSQFLATERRLNRLNATRADLLQLAVEMKLANRELRDIVLEIDGKPVRVSYVDTGGLIDLNTADPRLIEMLLMFLARDAGQARDAQGRYASWREDGHRFLRVSDLAAVTGLPMELTNGLAEMATVSSGRSGIAPAEAPEAVLRLVTGRSTGERKNLAAAVPQDFISQVTGETFQVRMTYGDEKSEILGTIYVRRHTPAAWVLDVG